MRNKTSESQLFGLFFNPVTVSIFWQARSGHFDWQTTPKKSAGKLNNERHKPLKKYLLESFQFRQLGISYELAQPSSVKGKE